MKMFLKSTYKFMTALILILSILLSFAIPMNVYAAGETLDDPFKQGPFTLGDVRLMRAKITTTAYAAVKAELIGQGKYINVWVFDDAAFHAAVGSTHTDTCQVDDLSKEKARNIAYTMDGIFERMTSGETGFASYAHRKVATSLPAFPYIGDVDDDGMLNVVIYPLTHLGVGGFYSNADFNINSPMGSHLDVINLSMPSIPIPVKLGVYSVFAHEFQHLLYDMSFGFYSNMMNPKFSWMNEALSEYVFSYYVQPGVQLPIGGRMSAASVNSYAASTAAYSDFVTLGGVKNYGTGVSMSYMFNKMTGGNYLKTIYSYFASAFPQAATAEQYDINRSKIYAKTMDENWGDVLQSLGIGAGGRDSFAEFYWMFMENFACDGGNVYNETGVSQTFKFSDENTASGNLWSMRKYDSDILPSGGTVSLGGYGAGTPRADATHEKFYKLTGDSDGGNTVLNIKVSDALAGNSTRYYVALKRESLSPDDLPNADIYPLTPGVEKKIYTGGKEAYLFTATLYRQVSSSVSYNWTPPEEGVIDGIVRLSNYTPKWGETVSAEVNAQGGAYHYAWSVGGVPVTGHDSSSYTTSINDVGKVIQLTVSSDSYSAGVLKTQSVAVAKQPNTDTPVNPSAAQVTADKIVLKAIPGYEYSYGGSIYQDSPVFQNLTLDETYTFYQRIKATVSRAESIASQPIDITTKIPPLVTGISISPENALLSKGETLQFTATVTGEYDPSEEVVWSLSGNKSVSTTIDANGILSIAKDETTAELTVTATAACDSSKSESVTVIIKAETKTKTFWQCFIEWLQYLIGLISSFFK